MGTSMTTQGELNFSTITRIAGEEENLAADVQAMAGMNCLLTAPVVTYSQARFGAQTCVSNAATLLRAGATDMVNRVKIVIINVGTGIVYVGLSGVTKTSGFALKENTTIEFPLSSGVLLYGITATGTHNVRIYEVGY